MPLPPITDDEVIVVGSNDLKIKASEHVKKDPAMSREKRATARQAATTTREHADEWGAERDNLDDDPDYDSDKQKCQTAHGKSQQATKQQLNASPTKNKKSRKANDSGEAPKPRKKPELPYEEYWKRIKAKEAEIQKLKCRLSTTKAKVEELKLVNQDLKENSAHEQKNLQQQLNDSRALTEEQESKLESMLEERHAILGKGQSPLTPDDEVTQDLGKAFEDLKTWAETYSVPSWAGMPTGNLESLGRSLKPPSAIAFASQAAIKAAQKGRIPPRVLLNAISNHLICQHTLVQPFSFLKMDDEGDYDEDAIDKFDWLLSLAKHGPSASRHNLRASMMQTVAAVGFPHLLKVAKLPAADAGQIHECFKSHRSHIVRLVLHDAAVALKLADETVAKVRNNELWKIVTDFAQLAIRLNTERPYTRAVLRNELQQHKFVMKHKLFRAHRMLKLKEDSHDDGVDPNTTGILNKTIDLVVEPVICRSGDADGEHYDQERVLRKAVVWMVVSEELSSPAPTDAPKPSSSVQAPNSHTAKITNQNSNSDQKRKASAATSPIAVNSTTSITDQSRREEQVSIKAVPDESKPALLSAEKGRKRANTENIAPPKKQRTLSPSACNSASTVPENNMSASTKLPETKDGIEPASKTSPKKREYVIKHQSR